MIYRFLLDKIGPFPLPFNARVLRGLPEQFSWVGLRAEVEFDQKMKMGFLICRDQKLSFWETAVKIHEIVGTPSDT